VRGEGAMTRRIVTVLAVVATTWIVVHAGEVLHLPSNLPHEAHALEDTLDVDVFCPPREDWLNKTDSYLRK
jgi:quercetin dioxygenase-like cupin family protein